VNGKIKAAQPKHVPNLQGKTDFMRYTPQQGGVGQQKIIKMVKIPLFSLSPRFSSSSPRPSLHLPNSSKVSTLLTNHKSSLRILQTEVVEDPLEPPMFKGKKIPRGPPSPPPPVLRSPPRKVTAQEQKDWMIPPCVSNWKNNKGYTIPLDKRLAADGRGLQDVRFYPFFFLDLICFGGKFGRADVFRGEGDE